MALSEPRFLSEPHRVVFAGWETTTRALQRAGWRLSANEDFMGRQVTIAMHFDPCGLYMVADGQDYAYGSDWRYSGRDREPRLTFVVRRAASDFICHAPLDLTAFVPIDAEPQFVDSPRTSMKDFNIFAAPLVRTQEIIVEPKDVAECMAWAQRLQSKSLAEIRERQRRRERNEAMQQDVFHAQILSLAA